MEALYNYSSHQQQPLLQSRHPLSSLSSPTSRDKGPDGGGGGRGQNQRAWRNASSGEELKAPSPHLIDRYNML
jgi:hypothetical protein